MGGGGRPGSAEACLIILPLRHQQQQQSTVHAPCPHPRARLRCTPAAAGTLYKLLLGVACNTGDSGSLVPFSNGKGVVVIESNVFSPLYSDPSPADVSEMRIRGMAALDLPPESASLQCPPGELRTRGRMGGSGDAWGWHWVQACPCCCRGAVRLMAEQKRPLRRAGSAAGWQMLTGWLAGWLPRLFCMHQSAHLMLRTGLQISQSSSLPAFHVSHPLLLLFLMLLPGLQISHPSSQPVCRGQQQLPLQSGQ